MTVSGMPAAPHYVPEPETKVALDYAELAIIDLAKANTVEDRKQLAVQAVDAVERQEYTIAQAERVFDVADIPFSGVSEEKKTRVRWKDERNRFIREL